jgi:large subunit ribosomal protein L32e
MSDKPRLLKIKAHLKKRQPVFMRQGAHKHKRVKKAWRAPKGLHSKMRDSRRGYLVKIQQGYHTPKDVRGTDKNGLYPTIVGNVAQLAALDPHKHSVIILGSLGARKRILIIEAANARKFAFVNAKADTVTQLKARFEKRTSEKKVREATKQAKKKSLEEKADAAAKKADEKKHDEKKSDEKKTEEHHVPKHENN